MCGNRHRQQSDAIKRNKEAQICVSPRSYAQVVSPIQHGVKRTVEERAGLSPIDCSPKRSLRTRVSGQKLSVHNTPPGFCHNGDENDSPGERTPDSCLKASSGVAQRRLFPSPNTGQLTPARHANRYVFFHHP